MTNKEPTQEELKELWREKQTAEIMRAMPAPTWEVMYRHTTDTLILFLPEGAVIQQRDSSGVGMVYVDGLKRDHLAPLPFDIAPRSRRD